MHLILETLRYMNIYFDIQCGAIITQSIFFKILMKGIHSSPVRLRYGVSLVNKSLIYILPHHCSDICNIVLYAGPRYNGTQLYITVKIPYKNSWINKNFPTCLLIGWQLCYQPVKGYLQVSNIRCTSVGNKIVDHSDVVGTSPVGAAPTTSSFST